MLMLYDLIYPVDESSLRTIPCVVAAAYFDSDELKGFGVDPSAWEVREPFREDNESEKVFKLWDSPLYLREFFSENAGYFSQDYWNGITEDEFVIDVTRALNEIRNELLRLFRCHDFHTVVQPLDVSDADARMYRSIRVKVKQGWIHKRLAFRFYAIEVEEEKCYIITGAAIKIHKDMMKAPNTAIEKSKLDFALHELASHGVDTKELFIDFIL